MENKKIYARQVPPEYQESPLQQCEEYPENVFVFGNPHLIGHRADEIDEIREALENIAYNIEIAESLAEIIAEYFPAKLTDDSDNRRVLRAAARLTHPLSDRHEQHEAIADALAVIYPEEFRACILRGCCQSDWQYCIYPAAYGDKFREVFETEYFNTGTEWIIHDGDDAPEEPDDIDGFSMYCTRDPREEIAVETGVTPADVVLYEFDGYTRRAAWKVV